MADKTAFRLRIKRLDFISAVDAGAQGPVANVALIKRAPKKGGSPRIEKATCKVFKLDDKLGLVFGWAMAGTLDGGETPHVDLQDDAIDVNGDDFIKACAEFMEAGAASDVMHDGRKDGRIVFAMPLVKGVNEALGIKSNVEGFAIAMKPSPETFKRFQTGELAAFSIGGIGEREPLTPVEEKRAPQRKRLAKQVVLTDIVDGHQHAIDLDDPIDWCGDRLSTTWATSEGAEVQHCHVWTFDTKTGAITIGEDSGHGHAVDAVIPPAVLAAFVLNEHAEAQETATAVLAEVLDGNLAGAEVNVSVAARAPQGNSTPTARPARLHHTRRPNR